MRGKKKTRIYNSRMGTPAGRDCYLLCSLCQESCLAHGKQFRKCLLNELGDRHQFTQKHTFRFILQPFRLLPFKLVKWFHTSERELSPVLPVLSYFSFRQGNTVVSMIYLNWHLIPVRLPGKSHGRRSLVGCSPWGGKASDSTERLHFHFSLSCIGEGDGNPLQCSCLENPRDGGAWWAAVYGVTQSRTRLKWLSNSNSNTCIRSF